MHVVGSPYRQESRSIVTITYKFFTTDRPVTFSSIGSRYACSGNVSLSLSISRTRSLREGSRKRPPRFCGRKVADAGLRQTDQEESRLPPPVLKAHVDDHTVRLRPFVRPPSHALQLRMEVCAPGSVDMSKSQTLWKIFIKAFVTKWQIPHWNQDRAKEEFN